MLRRLVEKFQDRVDLPIEIDEIRSAIVELGFQDKIVLSAETLDTGTLRGVFYQWREHGTPYAEPAWTSLVIYPENETLEWQRVICAKELIHICDKQIVKTQDPDKIIQLARKVVGPFETSAPDESDLMASMDKLAHYQSFNLLFPIAARRLARKRLKSGAKTLPEIADWAVLPLESVAMVMDERWDSVSELLVALGNGEHGPAMK